MKKTIVLILIMASFACILSGCGTKKDSNVVHVGYFNNITHSQGLYMHAKGSLEDRLGQDMTVSWTSFNAGPAEVEALFSGDVDIGYIGPVPGIISNVRSKGDITYFQTPCSVDRRILSLSNF